MTFFEDSIMILLISKFQSCHVRKLFTEGAVKLREYPLACVNTPPSSGSRRSGRCSVSPEDVQELIQGLNLHDLYLPDFYSTDWFTELFSRWI